MLGEQCEGLGGWGVGLGVVDDELLVCCGVEGEGRVVGLELTDDRIVEACGMGLAAYVVTAP